MNIFRQIWIDLDRFGSCKFDLQMLKCCLCKWLCMFGNDSGFGCMLDRFLDKFWTSFGVHVWTLLVQFLIPNFFFNHFDYFWTGFGMHIWTLLVQFLIPKKTFNHLDYFLTDLFMHV
jgi:hypothetical protein